MKQEWDDKSHPARHFVDMIDALAFLPPAIVPRVFDELVSRAAFRPVSTRMDKFVSYKRKFYIGELRMQNNVLRRRTPRYTHYIYAIFGIQPRIWI